MTSTLNPDDPTHVDLIAKTIADREFGCAEGRWELTVERAEAGGDYSRATIARLRVAARDVIVLINRELAKPAPSSWKTIDSISVGH
jgi:hypothetical protein